MSYMQCAIRLAQKAYAIQEIPVGCLIVQNGRIIASGFNQKEAQQCSLYHAEMLAIHRASQKLHNYRLLNCELYTTLEPCLMCAGAIIAARIPKVYIGSLDPKAGAMGSLYQTHLDQRLNHQPSVIYLPHDEIPQLMKKFFKELRQKHVSLPKPS